MIPTRLSFVTYNIWNIQRWPLREPALREFFRRFRPDIFCLQELRIEPRDTLDAALHNYQRVEDPFPGWVRESTIYWNSDLLEEVEHGVEDIAIHSDAYRRLFWVRLQVKEKNKNIFVATAHYTYQGHPDEMKAGLSPRIEQARQTVSALQRLVQPGEPAFFMGDLNDPVLPLHVFMQAGFQNCFAPLGLLPPPTWPAIPTMRIPPTELATSQTIDWILSNDQAHSIIATVPHFYYEDVAPSDHWPVYAMFELA